MARDNATYQRELRRTNPEYAERCRVLSREAKARRRGVCERCGGETRYNGVTVNGPSRLCGTCNTEIVVARQKARRGTGPTNSRVIEYLSEPHTFTEVYKHFGLSKGWACGMLARLRRYGLIRRVSRGVYVASDGAREQG